MTNKRKNTIKKAVQEEFKMRFFEVTEWAGDVVSTSRGNLNTLNDEERQFLKTYVAELIENFEFDMEVYLN